MTPAETVALRLVAGIYEGSDGEMTKALFARLERLGPAGLVAVNLFRAHKNSARAKGYRGGVPGQGSYRSMAYGRKQWAMEKLCQALGAHGEALGLVWGWGYDATTAVHSYVLYIDLPSGQVSFHTDARGEGPDYPGVWDGVLQAGAGRVCAWLAKLLADDAQEAGFDAPGDPGQGSLL